MDFKHQIEPLLSSLAELATSHQLSAEMQAVSDKHANYKLRLPFIGAFSAGKSTLINALLGDKLLATNITAETCLPTEISYAPQESFTLMNAGGEVACLTREQVREQLLPSFDSAEEHWLEIGLPNSLLANVPELVLVDMPGWDSGIEAHSRAIDGYIQSSGAYCIVVSAEDGSLRDSLKLVLAELKLMNKPVALVVSKCDKKAAEDVPAVSQTIVDGITSIMGKAPQQVLTVSARKAPLDELKHYIQQLPLQSAAIYQNMVGRNINLLADRIVHKVSLLLNQDNLTIEQVQQQCERIPQELAELEAELNKAASQLQQILPGCISAARNNLENNLKGQLDGLAHTVLHGGSIQDTVGQACRQAYLTMMEQDFKPKVQLFLQNLPVLQEFSHSASHVNGQFVATPDSSNMGSVVSQVVLQIITLIPQLKAFRVVLSAIAVLFGSEWDKKRQQEQQLEQARQHVLYQLIPQVLTSFEPALSESLRQALAVVEQELKAQCCASAADKQQALQQLKQQLAAAQAQDAENKARLQAELAQLQYIKQLLGALSA
ncbi:dynamin family protein [Shewanella algae]|uniref:dynamin family protein n=1 Tax=Shewanella algae TaxID=38313 RepID=UPI001BF15B63|nr:dynamin family protein [Shewanella algae]BCV28944.1 hypothetical protein TUM3811_28040 [Shewanella algae]